MIAVRKTWVRPTVERLIVVAFLAAPTISFAEDSNWACCDAGPRTLFRWSGAADDGEPAERFGKFKDETIVTDRPDFTEASTTVGKGVVQLETGYTYFYDRSMGEEFQAHSFPEALFRIGVFADWLEFRIAYNYSFEREEGGTTISELDGSNDLYLGAKIALTEQEGILPEMAILPQMTVPLGGPFTTGQVEPGVNWLYSWEVNDFVSIAGSSQINRSAAGAVIVGFDPMIPGNLIETGETQEHFMEFAQSAAVGFSLTEKLGAYSEWFVLVPVGADGAVATEHFANGGFTYLVNNNLQLDVRAGVGLNASAVDFFSGVGMSVRF